jgi:hypothetical protein
MDLTTFLAVRWLLRQQLALLAMSHATFSGNVAGRNKPGCCNYTAAQKIPDTSFF